MIHVDSDSWKHFGVNAACVLVGSLAGAAIGWWAGNVAIGLLFGMATGIGVGIGASLTREYDGLQFYGHWCWVDLLFDALGIIVITGLDVLSWWLIK